MTASAVDSLVASAIAEYIRDNPNAGTTATPEEPVVPVKPLELKEGEELFSTRFGYVPVSGDFAIRECEPHPDMVQWIPTVDPDYVVQKEECAILVRGIMENDKTLMTGPTGSGKSSLVRYVAAILKWPFIRINMTGDMDTASFFGQIEVRSGSTVWTNGAMTDAVQFGALVLVDEWDITPPEIGMGMQNLLEDGGFLFLKEKPGTLADRTIHPHANWRVVYAGNTLGQGDDNGEFGGTFVQNTATIDRFTNTILLDYLDKAHEKSIITGKTGVPAKLAQDMVSLASLVRNAYSSHKLGLTMSPRTLINWARKTVSLGNREEAFRRAYWSKLRKADKAAVAEMYHKVFSAAL